MTYSPQAISTARSILALHEHCFTMLTPSVASRWASAIALMPQIASIRELAQDKVRRAECNFFVTDSVRRPIGLRSPSDALNYDS